MLLILTNSAFKLQENRPQFKNGSAQEHTLKESAKYKSTHSTQTTATKRITNKTQVQLDLSQYRKWESRIRQCKSFHPDQITQTESEINRMLIKKEILFTKMKRLDTSRALKMPSKPCSATSARLKSSNIRWSKSNQPWKKTLPFLGPGNQCQKTVKSFSTTDRMRKGVALEVYNLMRSKATSTDQKCLETY